MSAEEINFDGLVGLTHHYAGLSFGNMASTANQYRASNPRLAALQGLKKMKALSDLGFKQGVIPPQERPCLNTLRRLGFSGTDAQVISRVSREAPYLLTAVSSASSMWVANAATVSPSADTADGKVHFTVANLNSKFHRAIESRTTAKLLQAMFNDSDYFVHHPQLPSQDLFGDEGAANHNRLCRSYADPGVEVFVYGRQARGSSPEPQKYPARQTREASEAIARLHRLPESNRVFVQQNPVVIDQGVFHNDVISVSNGPVWLYHQQAFLDPQPVFDDIRRKLEPLSCEFVPIEVPDVQVSVKDAVDSYLFNSQLLTKTDGQMLMVVPEESHRHPGVWAYLRELVQDNNPINDVKVFDLRESMCNGGGPACLRLRVVLNEDEQRAVTPGVLLDDLLFRQLSAWIEKHYRDRLTEADLADPMLYTQTCTALDELTRMMGLGSIYPFQL
jgi:succinylarginine dihydrolase